MFRIEIHHLSSGKCVPYGEPFEKIETVYEKLIDLDAEFVNWENQGFPLLPADNPLMFVEFGEIYIKGNGLTYWMNENNELQIMN